MDQTILCSKIWTLHQIFPGKMSFCALSTEPAQSFTHHSPGFKAGSETMLSHQRQGGFLFSVYFGHSLCVLLCIESYNPRTRHFTNYIKDLTHPLLNGGRTPTDTMKTGLSTNLLYKPWMHFFSSPKLQTPLRSLHFSAVSCLKCTYCWVCYSFY